MKNILFYASVKDPSLFQTQMFYVNTTNILRQLGFEVKVTNKMKDAWTEDYDGFFCFFYRKGVVPAYLAKIRGKKVFFTGGLDSLEKTMTTTSDYFRQVVTFKLCRWIADYCLIESTSDMRHINEICFFKNHKNLYYAPQAIDVAKYDCSLADKEKLFSTICWQGTEGNVKRKGVDKALYCFKRLHDDKRFENYKFIIMGRKGAGTPFLEKLVDDLGLKESVFLTGEVSEEEKLKVLKRSKFFFQLSNYEGFGLAALEAIASKCIPIHSKRGGLADTLADDGVIYDINKFDGTIGSIDSDIADRLFSIKDEDVENTYMRIEETFDEKVRQDNFRKTVGVAMNN